MLPAWLHALACSPSLPAALDGVARAPCLALARSRRRPAPPGAGWPAAAPAAALARRSPLGRRRGQRDPAAVASAPGAAASGGAQPEGRAAALRPAAPRSLGAARRARSAPAGRLRPGGRHGAGAAGPGLRNRSRRPGRSDTARDHRVGHAADLYRAAAVAPGGRAAADRRSDGRGAQQVEVPVGSEVLAQLHHSGLPRSVSLWASTRRDAPSRPSGRTAPKRR